MVRWPALLFALILVACGGGGGDAPSGAPPSVVASSPAAPAAMLAGVAATGAPVSGRIFLKDAAGHEQFVDTTDGTYQFTLTSLSAPFMLKAQWTSAGVAHTLYSFATDAAGGTANITPFTHMAVVAAAGTDSLDALYDTGSPSAYAAVAAALPAAVAQVRQTLAPLLAKQDVEGVDPITGAFAADHTGMDAVLDGIAVAYAGGTLTIVDSTSGAVVLSAPSVDLAHAMTMPGWSLEDAAVAGSPDVAVAANGDGLVAWSEVVAGHSVVRARFLAGPVGAATTLSLSGDAGLPRVAFDTASNAVVVWTQYENGRNDIWARRYVAASATWDTPVRVSRPDAVADANVPDVAVDAAGNAIVVWHQGDGRVNHFDVWQAGYAAATGQWSAAALASNGIDSAYNPKIALDTAGAGIAAWTQQQGDGTTVSNGPQDTWARPVATTGAWGAATRLNAVAGDVAWVYGQIAVAMDAQGNGAVLWVQGAPGVSPFLIHAARYTAAGGWQASTAISTSTLDASYGPQLAFDATGHGVAVWQQQTGVGAYAGVNRFDPAAGWGTPGALGTDVAGDVWDPHVAVDGAGNATAVWTQWDANGLSVTSSRSLAGGAWSASLRVADTPTDGYFTMPAPRVAANPSGQTLVVWGTNSY